MQKKVHEDYAAHVGELILQAIEQRLADGQPVGLQEVAHAWATVTNGLPPERSERDRRPANRY